MRSMSRKHALALSAALVALALGGCGGGGGTGARPDPIAAPPPAPPPPPVPVPPPPPPPPGPTGSVFDDAEYQRSNGANAHGAISAYNAGATGKGVKIGVVDSGVNPNLADFAGKIDPASADLVAHRGISDTDGHGTAVTAVAAAARNGSGVMGVAFDATILSFNSSDPTDCKPDDGCQHDDIDIAQGIDLARTNGARVINISLGGADPSSLVNAAVARAAAAGIVVVLSAGNSGADAGGANPEGFAAAAAAAGGGNVILAGAVDSNGTMASFSNRAGTGAQDYLAAIGVRVLAPDQTGTLFFWSGTSFSAPVISGAVALLAQAFPNLTGRQIIDILFASATDAGAPGTDAVFGHGILNIARAFQPQGALSLPGSRTAVDPAAGVGTTASAMGDAAPRLGGVVVLDGFSRAFVMDLGAALRRAPVEQPLASGLQQGLSTAGASAGRLAVALTVRRDLAGQPEVGLAQLGLTREDSRKARLVSGLAVSRLTRRTALAFGFSESGRSLEQRLAGQSENAFLVARDPLARTGFYGESGASLGVRQSVGGFGLTATSERGQVYRPGFDRVLRQDGYTIGSFSLDRRLGPASLTLGASRLREERTVLGGRLSGTLTAAGATSWFADATASVALGRGWSAFATYRRGWTSLAGTGGLARGGRLASDAWALDLAKRDALLSGDRFALRVTQPLRVRSGGLDLSVPVSYDYATLAAGYESRFFNLTPSGREIDVEAAYALPVLGGALSGNVFARRQPGHIAAMDSDLGAAIRFTLGF
jgi:Subtilase family